MMKNIGRSIPSNVLRRQVHRSGSGQRYTSTSSESAPRKIDPGSYKLPPGYNPPRKKKDNIFITTGVPLIILIFSGSVLMSYFMDSNIEIKGRTSKSTTPRQFDIDEEHRLLMKKLDIENYTLSRIPRPEEEEEEQSRKDKENKPN
jgi:hypothetical protein